MIPLAIFYSSLTKLFFLLLLSIWRPDSPSSIEPARVRYASLWKRNATTDLISKALDVWDEDLLDREWVIRNVLGGMSTGFGLRGSSPNENPRGSRVRSLTLFKLSLIVPLRLLLLLSSLVGPLRLPSPAL